MDGREIGRVAIGDWPKLRDRRDFELLEVRQGVGAETILVVRRMDIDMEDNDFRPKPSKLSYRLMELMRLAREQIGEPQRMQLPSGLRVDAIYGKDGTVRLQISREGIYPSHIEWTTTINNLPFENLQIGAPERFEHKGACYLRTGWAWVDSSRDNVN